MLLLLYILQLPTPLFTVIVDVVGHRVAPLHPEGIVDDIATKWIIFSCSLLSIQDIPIEVGRGIIDEIGTTLVAVFVPLAPGTIAGLVDIAKDTAASCTGRTSVTVGSTVAYLGLIGLHSSHGGYMLDQLVNQNIDW